jgi:hypothetical protein
MFRECANAARQRSARRRQPRFANCPFGVTPSPSRRLKPTPPQPIAQLMVREPIRITPLGRPGVDRGS